MKFEDEIQEWEMRSDIKKSDVRRLRLMTQEIERAHKLTERINDTKLKKRYADRLQNTLDNLRDTAENLVQEIREESEKIRERHSQLDPKMLRKIRMQKQHEWTNQYGSGSKEE